MTAEAAERDKPLLRALAGGGTQVNEVTDRALRAVAETVTPQGIVGVVTIPADTPLPDRPRLVAVLERCADPGNAGAVIRTADAVGADAVVLGQGSVDVWSGKCVRSSAGSVFHIPLVTALDAADCVEQLRTRGCQVFATAADGECSLDDLSTDGRLAAPTAWVFGSESHGLGTQVAAGVDAVVRIPIEGRAESFNLAAAAAICLYSSASVQRLNQG